MAESNVDSKMKNLNLNQKTDINILLLGSTGVGKSTMINSFANYLTYGELKAAKKDKLLVLIPSQLNVMDKNGEYHVISTGDTDSNEYLQTGESATQDVKTYVFPLWNGLAKIRLIDSPGMGDTRGIKQDDINSENILSYISNLHELHAICFLLKPNESRNTVFFKYCIDQIFSRLDKSASENIIFCFTNTRGTDYSPGETVGVLKKTVEEIGNRPPYAKIPFDKNIFCFDNEPFRYLAAVNKGIEFSSEIKQRNKDSWVKSAEQCWKLINYIVGDKDKKPLKPHHVKSTNAINEARRMINQLAHPLAEIMQLIHQNMSVLDRHRELLDQDTASLEEMKSKLYMPVIALEVTPMDRPATVCTARKCADIILVAGKNSWHYKQRCHDPCYLTNVGKEQLGDPNLISCTAMRGTNTCSQCFCDYRVHMHIYYTAKPVEKREKDENMQKKITNRFELMENKQRLVRDMEMKQKELADEHKVIVEICAKFAHFLQNNAITPFSDAYKDYIEYLIDREKSLGRVCDMEAVKYLEGLLLQYVETKNRFDEALRITKTVGREELVTSKEISDSVQILYKLKHNGRVIRDLYNCQKKARSKEFQQTEYVHQVSYKAKEKKENDKKERKSSTYDKKKDKKEKRNDGNDGKKDKKDKRSDGNDEKKDKKEKRGDGSDQKKDKRDKKSDNEKRQQQNRGNARGNSPPPSYHEAQFNQRPNRNQPPRGFAPHFNQFPNRFPPPGTSGYPNMGPFPPQGGPFSSEHHFTGNLPDGPPREYKINVSLQTPNDTHANSNVMSPNSHYPNQPQSSHIPSLIPPNSYPSAGYDPRFPPHMNNPYPYDQHHGINWHHSGGNQPGFRGNEHGGRFRDNRGRGGINKRSRGKKGKGGVNTVKENEKTAHKNEKKKSSSTDSSDSTDSTSSSD